MNTMPKSATDKPGFSIVSPLATAILLAGLFVFPQVIDSPYALHIMILLFLSIIMGESWNILGGYTGQYSVGHAAYFGAGAYTTMILMQYRQIPPGSACGPGRRRQSPSH